jgi:hypothetical protein
MSTQKKKRSQASSTTHKHKQKDISSSSPTSLFHKGRLKTHIAIPPAAIPSLDTFLQSHLTATLLLKHTAYGTIVSFSNFHPLSGQGRILDECPFSWSWFEGDVVLFSPKIGQRTRKSTRFVQGGTNVLGAQVTLGSPDHVALIAFALFNVSVPRTEIPEDWRFEEWWVDGEGLKVDGELEVEVTQYGSLKETRTNVD